MVLKEILERYVTKIKLQLEDCTAKLISLKALYPDNSQQTSLKPLLVLNSEIDRNYYDAFESKFVEDGKFSLSFSKYSKSVKLQKINLCSTKGRKYKLSTDYNYYVNDDSFHLTKEIRERFENVDIGETWNRWATLIKDDYENLNGKYTLWSYVVLPRIINNKEEHFIASAFLIFSSKLPVKNAIIINKFCQDLLIECITNHFYSELLTRATRAAIADIINRNYAHHIGSHVSHRSSFQEILKRLNITENEVLADKKVLVSIAQMRNRLEEYKDERSEYIANVTSTVPQSFYLYTDVIRPFVENTLIIDNIAANEGIRYYVKDNGSFNPETPVKLSASGCCTISQLVIRVFIHESLTTAKLKDNLKDHRTDLTPVPCGYLEQKVIYFNDKDKREPGNQKFDSVSLPYYIEVPDMISRFYEHAETTLNDIQIMLPGALGKHAIYSLLENYIRNTAKHAYKTKHTGKPVEIILELSPDPEAKDKITFSITDNISDTQPSDKEGKTIIDKLSPKIQSKIIDKDGMGIADMKISACLLADRELNDENLRDSLAVCSTNENHLEYTMQLSRPKAVALIGCHKERNKIEDGIYYFESIKAFLEGGNKGFQFAIVGNLKDEEIEKKDIGLYNNFMPLRTFVLQGEGEEENNNITTNRYSRLNKNTISDDETLIQWCWKNWIIHKTQNSNTLLAVYFEQEKSDTPTKQWEAIAGSYTEAEKYTMKVFPKNDIATLKNESSDSKRLTLFDRHAGLIGSLQGTNTKFLSGNFWELVDKNNPDFDYMFSTSTDQKPFTLPYEMMDAALTKVLVIDERVAEISNRKISENHLNPLTNYGFRKFSQNNRQNLTLFDVAWAAGVHIATHFNGKPLHNNCDKTKCKEEHFLEVCFSKNDKDEIAINTITNFIEHKYTLGEPDADGNRCWKNTETIITECDWQSNLCDFDVILIHRTKLKELLEDDTIGYAFLSQANFPKVYVVTGGGVVDYLTDEQKNITILPINILRDYIMGNRVAKLMISKILK